MIAQENVIASLENNGGYITRDIKMFLPSNPAICSYEIIQN